MRMARLLISPLFQKHYFNLEQRVPLCSSSSTQLLSSFGIDDDEHIMPDDSSAPLVELVWKIALTTTPEQTRKLHAEVALQEISNEGNGSDTTTRRKTQQSFGSQQRSDEEQAVPASVLQFERQMRKAQHAKKTGLALKAEDLQVVYVDEHLVVVNKPSGVLTVPGINCNPSLVDLVHEKYGIDDIDPAKMIVHRLDMDTSGLVIFGRTPEVTKKLHSQFRDKQITKEYECVVNGHLLPSQQSGGDQQTSIRIDLPLQRDHERPPFMRVSTPRSEQAAIEVVADLQQHGWKKLVRKRPKPSQTAIRVVEHGNRGDSLPYTRLRLVPITGRTHQLRVHCAALGYPIIGDPTYSLYGEASPVGGLEDVESSCVVDISSAAELGDGGSLIIVDKCNMSIQKAWTIEHPPNEKPMCLHAALLHLEHPVTGELMKWDVPPDF